MTKNTSSSIVVNKKGRPKTFNKAQASRIAMETYWKEGIENVSLNEKVIWESLIPNLLA